MGIVIQESENIKNSWRILYSNVSGNIYIFYNSLNQDRLYYAIIDASNGNVIDQDITFVNEPVGDSNIMDIDFDILSRIIN